MKFLKTLLLIVGIASLAACTRVDTGYVGIESTVGQVKSEELPPGLYMTLLKNVTEVTTKEIALPLDNLTPKSANNITMTDFDVDVYYKVNPAMVADMYVKYSGDLTRLANGDVVVGNGFVYRQAREAAYKVAGKFDASIMHTKRTEIAAAIIETLQRDLDTDAGKGAFVVTNVNIRSIVTDPKLEESIRQSAQVEFDVKRKQQESQLAEAESKRKLIEAEGEAAANRKISESLTPQLVQLRLAELRRDTALAIASKQGNTVLMEGGNAMVNVK